LFARFTGCICAFCADIIRVAHKFDCYLLTAAFQCYHCEPFTRKISEILLSLSWFQHQAAHPIAIVIPILGGRGGGYMEVCSI